MIRIRDIILPPEHNAHQLGFEAAQMLHISPSKIRQMRIVRRSVDARKKPNVRIVYTIDVQVEGSEADFMRTLKATDAWYSSAHQRAEASAEHARTGGVKEEKILNSVSELDVKLGVERKKGFLERFKKR